jgi:hypothetical protein
MQTYSSSFVSIFFNPDGYDESLLANPFSLKSLAIFTNILSTGCKPYLQVKHTSKKLGNPNGGSKTEGTNPI